MSFTTSPAMIRPATDGTKEILPGICRRMVHLRVVPEGQIQPVVQLDPSVSFGIIGVSFE